MYRSFATLLVVAILSRAARADETAAVALILASDGEIGRDTTQANKPVITARFRRATDADLKVLKALKDLTTLDLSYSPKVTDVGLKELKELKHLTALNLYDSSVTDAGWRN